MTTSFDFLFDHNHEQLVYRYDKETGLRALIAVHNTVRGPGLGGTRLWHYDSIADAALDVLRLSEGMTYKAAVAGLPLGGAKSVIMADGKEDDPIIREARFKKFGEFIDSVGGNYIAAEDVGTHTDDMVNVLTATSHVVGLPKAKGGSGDPSPITALGVMAGIKALVEDVLKRETLVDVRVAMQGLGKVGLPLAKMLIDAGAVVIGADVNAEAIEEARDYGVEIVSTDAIYDVNCDIFSPCALGAILNDATIPRLDCQIVAGSANNQLAELRHGDMLHERGIAYGVDYVINAGGLINVHSELEGYDEAKARTKTEGIYDTIKQIMERARVDAVTPLVAAQRIAHDALQPEAMAF